MNKFLTKENNNSYESGKSEDTDLKELNKEKELKGLETEIKNIKDKLEDNKTKSMTAEFLTFEILFGEIIIFAFSKDAASTSSLITSMSIFYAAVKALSLLTLGSRIPRYIKKKKLTTAISNLEKEKVMLETKEENKTKTNNISNNNIRTYNNILNYQSPNKYISKEKCKKRVLKKELSIKESLYFD